MIIDSTNKHLKVAHMGVAYLGPKASFSHQAALAVFRDSTVKLEAVSSFAGIFDVVQSGKFEYGIVPFENSSNGSVMAVLDLLGDREAKHSDVRVCAEYYLPVQHQLLVKAPDSGALSLEDSLKSIRKIYSHPQVWGQCSAFLSRPVCRSIATQDCSSTSEAARLVSESEPGTTAAIASDLAATEFRLQTLVPNIEDRDDNTTRFFVLRKAGTYRLPPLPQDGLETQNYKNLVLFTIDHEQAGTLAEALSVFKRHNFNLTSINTRPSRLRPWHYIFFTECWQAYNEGGANAIRDMIADLDTVASSCRHVGAWKDQSNIAQGRAEQSD